MEDEEILVSVIVPVFNAERTISRCIDSVLNQSFVWFELILVDDGSLDNSGRICDSYAGIDKRINTIHKRNGGASDARNAGIEEAKGKYICFLDSDDYLKPDFLSVAFEKMDNGNVDLFLCGLQQIFPNTTIEYSPKFIGACSVTDLYNRVLVDVPQICVCGPWCKLFRREVIAEKGLKFDTSMRCGEDTVFVLTYSRYIKKVFVDDASLYCYDRGNTESLFSGYNPQYYHDNIFTYDEWLKLLFDLNCSETAKTAIKERYLLSLLNNLNTAFRFNRSWKEKNAIMDLLHQDKFVNSGIRVKGKVGLLHFLVRCNAKWILFSYYSIKYFRKKKRA